MYNPRRAALTFVGIVAGCAVLTLAFAAATHAELLRDNNRHKLPPPPAVAARATVSFRRQALQMAEALLPVPVARGPAAAAIAAASYTSEDYNAAQAYIDECRARPRYSFFTTNMVLTKQRNLLCAPITDNSTDYADCQWLAYGESLVLLPAPAFIIAILAFPVMFVVFWAFRCCCWGTCNTTPDLCCGSHSEWDPTIHGYTPSQVRNLKVAVVVATVLVAVLMIIGLIGNSQLGGAITGLVELITGTADRVMEVLRRVAGRFAAMDSDDSDVFQSDINPPLQAALEQGQHFSDVIDTVENILRKVETGRYTFMFINLMLPFVLCVLALLAAFLGYYKLCWPLAVLGFICICLSWFTFGIHFPIGTGLADACYYINEGLFSQNPQASAAYNYLLSCNNDSGLEGLRNLALEGIDSAYNGACTVFRNGCNYTLPCDANGDGVYTPGEICDFLDCPAGQDPHTCSKETFRTWEKTTVNNYYVGCADPMTSTILSPCPYTASDPDNPSCPSGTVQFVCNGATAASLTLEECASSCASDYLRYAAGELRDRYAQIREFTQILTYDILPLVNCHTIQELFGNAKNYICVSVMRALQLITVAEGLLGAILIAATVLGILGIKRFNKKNWLKEAVKAEATVGAAMVTLQPQPAPTSPNIVVVMQQPAAVLPPQQPQQPPPPPQQSGGMGGGESYSSYSSYSTVSGDTRRDPKQAQAIVSDTLAEISRQPEAPPAYDYAAAQQQLVEQQKREEEAARLAAAELARLQEAQQLPPPPPFQVPFEQPTMETLRPEEEPEEQH